MNATATYNDSLFMQAVSLPDLLRPILLDDSMRDAVSKLSENAAEMKSIANVTQNLVRRVEKMINISISTETQAKLQKSIAEASELSVKIAKTCRDLRGEKFAITWQVNKIIKSAKKTSTMWIKYTRFSHLTLLLTLT